MALFDIEVHVAQRGRPTASICSLDDPRQSRQLGGVAAPSHDGWSTPTVATVAEGIGAAVAPLVAEQLRSSYVTSRFGESDRVAVSELLADLTELTTS
ncbi:hypothetical protein ACFZAE_06670 [Streptomyces scabiei]|uniref:hypothetical protein n=1 Tax=Streptomyces scabiei TaxID=1930 RepID=UPI0036EF5FA7